MVFEAEKEEPIRGIHAFAAETLVMVLVHQGTLFSSDLIVLFKRFDFDEICFLLFSTY
jgi:hypothetical protein